MVWRDTQHIVAVLLRGNEAGNAVSEMAAAEYVDFKKAERPGLIDGLARLKTHRSGLWLTFATIMRTSSAISWP